MRRRLHTAGFRAMGTDVDLVLLSAHPEERVAQVTRDVVDLFETVEGHCSRFRPHSELSALNAQSGRWVLVSDLLWDLLKRAEHHRERSLGLFDASILPALEAAGYDRDFVRLSRAPAGVPVLGLDGTPMHGWPDGQPVLELDRPAKAVRLRKGARLDLGGIAKGWTVDRALERVATLGPGLVNAGGDLAARGRPGYPWPLTVEDPQHPDRYLGRLSMVSGAVATSSVTRRRWWKDGRLQHHLIDPRTGVPAGSDVLAVTAWAETAEAADVGAKVLLLLPGHEREAWLARLDLHGALVVGKDGRLTLLGSPPVGGWEPVAQGAPGPEGHTWEEEGWGAGRNRSPVPGIRS